MSLNPGRPGRLLVLLVLVAVGAADAQSGIPFAPGVVLNYSMHNSGEEADRQLLGTIVSIIPDPWGLNCKVGGEQGGEVASGESLSTIRETTG